MIVTSNLRDFPVAALAEWKVEARHPDEFLTALLGLAPEEVMSRLDDQAATIKRTLPELLDTLKIGVPKFAATIASRLQTR